MTKAEEKHLFRQIAEAQPKDSYLRAILSSIVNDVDNAIDNDFGFISYRERMEAMDTHKKEIMKLKKEADDLRQQLEAWRVKINNAKHEHDAVWDRIQSIRTDALELYQRVMSKTLGDDE